MMPDWGAFTSATHAFAIFPFNTLAEHITWLTFAYFIALNTGYISLISLAAFAIRSSSADKLMVDLPQLRSAYEVPVSILVPAYNEAVTIVDSVRSLLQLSYGQYEVIVINDGSRDRTMDVLQRHFALVRMPGAHPLPLATRDTLGVYQSRVEPRLRVIDKVNGGKADALNAGINFARYPLFCSVDADSVLESRSLHNIVRPFARDPLVVATGGTIRVANGCSFRDGSMTRLALPTSLLATFQLVEYVRSFLLTRMGWSVVNGVLIVAGAFGLFKKDVVISLGGYHTGSVGEDMELVLRMHRRLREQGRKYRIVFVPDAVCWTEAPEDLKTLRNQRIRWQRGLGESLSAHWQLMFSRGGGVAGHVAFPFMLMFEFLGPLIEASGYLAMTILWLIGLSSWDMYLLFLAISVGIGMVLSLAGLLVEEIGFHVYSKRQLVVLGLVALVENCGYRQLNTWWRVVGLWRCVFGKAGEWGTMTRHGGWQRAD